MTVYIVHKACSACMDLLSRRSGPPELSRISYIGCFAQTCQAIYRVASYLLESSCVRRVSSTRGCGGWYIVQK